MTLNRSVFIILLSLFVFNLTACKTTEALQSSRVSSSEGSPVFGNPNAPIQMIEYTDFECHFCGQVQPALQQVLATYPTQVSLMFKNFPLSMHRHAHTAHLAAMCVNEQGKFWEYRKILFQHQQALKREDLLSYAQQLNLNMDQFTKCLDSEKYDAKVEADIREGIGNGVMGTPTFFINGQPLSGAQPYSSFEQLIKQSLPEQS